MVDSSMVWWDGYAGSAPSRCGIGGKEAKQPAKARIASVA